MGPAAGGDRQFERYLTRQGTVVLKFFLNVSKEEQKRRFLERLEETDKHWKFSASDLAERAFWDDYQAAYQEAIAATAAPHAPWFVVPADNNGSRRLVVVAAMIEALEALDLKLPALTPEQQAALEAARQTASERAGLGRRTPVRRRVMVRMLIDRDARQILGRRRSPVVCAGTFGSTAANQVEPALDAHHQRRPHSPRRVQAADGDIDMIRPLEIAECQRRAAARTEAALGRRGTAELRRCAACPGESASCTAAHAKNGPPTAFWHMRQWQMPTRSGCAYNA